MKTSAQYQVGIDLGTTNTVVAYAKIGSSEIQLFDIEQLVAPGEVAPRPLLPSLRFHATQGELAAADMALPWAEADATQPVVFGRWARQLGAQVPGRLVTSAKSWLSHAAVDRTAAILPWGAADDVAKISPLDASASYLGYVRAAWNHAFPKAPLEQQDIVLTVPASFDEGARALTVQAARQAGLPKLRLLEEPQAACYDWLFRHQATLNEELAESKLLLVCDVGGGTTDLSLIQIELKDGQPQLKRIGVGNHLMLGGDNMDLALAHLVERRLNPDGSAAALSAGRLSQLIERCRAAKEQLLAADAPEQVLVTLLGSGSKLIGGSRSAELTRAEVAQLVVDGFFPLVSAHDTAKQKRSGLVEFGLPYASDPAVTRHIASFLQQHHDAAAAALGSDDDAPAIPDTLLLNGGVFRAAALSQRLSETLGNWRGAPLKQLHNHNPDTAVACGAVAYALASKGKAPRISGGSARSYFLLLEGDGDNGHQALCLLPRGSEPGQEITLSQRSFALRLGQPVRFHLLSSIADAHGQPPTAGELIDIDAGEFLRLPPIATVLQASNSGGRGEIPVQLATSLTEVGTLAIACVDLTNPAQRWSLEFQLRGHSGVPQTTLTEEAPHPHLSDAVEKIDRVFGNRAKDVAASETKQLRATLERLLGKRETWPTPLLRQLFDVLLQRAKGRRRSAEHERLWLNLAGYCLRPGYGYPLDDWRIEQLWALFEPGVQYRNDTKVCSEWWTLWRRVAGGLPQTAQLRLLDDFALILDNNKDEIRKRAIPPVKGSEDDMVRLAASLERAPANYKLEIGNWLMSQIAKGSGDLQRHLWAIGRLGARQPFYGSAHDVIPAEQVADWLFTLLEQDWKKLEPAAFAAAHLSRRSGDRNRDMPDEIREVVIERLQASKLAPAWAQMVSEVVELDTASVQQALGESLPPGLKLLG